MITCAHVQDTAQTSTTTKKPIANSHAHTNHHSHNHSSGQLPQSNSPVQTSNPSAAIASATWSPAYDDSHMAWNPLYQEGPFPIHRSDFGGMEEGVARAYRDMCDLEKTVMDATGCTVSICEEFIDSVLVGFSKLISANNL